VCEVYVLHDKSRIMTLSMSVGCSSWKLSFVYC